MRGLVAGRRLFVCFLNAYAVGGGLSKLESKWPFQPYPPLVFYTHTLDVFYIKELSFHAIFNA